MEIELGELTGKMSDPDPTSPEYVAQYSHAAQSKHRRIGRYSLQRAMLIASDSGLRTHSICSQSTDGLEYLLLHFEKSAVEDGTPDP